MGSVDYYIVFRDRNDNWSDPINLGAVINTESGREYSPYVSPDGNYFFFMAARVDSNLKAIGSLRELRSRYVRTQNGNSDIYWMKADFIEDLR
jgi:hypothetical protein